MILTSIKYLIGLELGQKGYPPSVVAPVINLLRLMEEELVAVGFDFTNPEIEKEEDRLRQAIVRFEGSDDFDSPTIEEIPGVPFPQIPSIIVGLNGDEEDEDSWLDDDDGN